jgi:hypothetical protein
MTIHQPTDLESTSNGASRGVTSRRTMLRSAAGLAASAAVGTSAVAITGSEPHVVSTQEYVFGLIKPESPFPANKLMSGGVEGAFDPATNPQMRAVIGGTGTYAGATGQAAQFLIGQNTDTDSDGLNSSTLRFAFDVRTRRHASIETLASCAGLS